MTSYIVLDQDGNQAGSMESDALPQAGDVLVLRHPLDGGPTWKVLRREFVNGETYVIVVSVPHGESVAAAVAS
jgi:hypothetical protein